MFSADQTYSYKELRSIYGVSHKTFTKWLRLILGERDCKRNRVFNIAEVEMIFGKLGYPKKKNTLNANKRIELFYEDMNEGLDLLKYHLNQIQKDES